MKHTFLVFPGGSTGAALFLLRVAVSVALLASPVASAPSHSYFTIASYPLALAVGVGLYTRAVVLLSVIFSITAVIAAGALPSVAFITFALQAIALSLMGPGAISIDSKLFGRRTVHLQH